MTFTLTFIKHFFPFCWDFTNEYLYFIKDGMSDQWHSQTKKGESYNCKNTDL